MNNMKYLNYQKINYSKIELDKIYQIQILKGDTNYCQYTLL